MNMATGFNDVLRPFIEKIDRHPLFFTRGLKI